MWGYCAGLEQLHCFFRRAADLSKMQETYDGGEGVITWFDDPALVKVEWDDATNLPTWHDREEIEKHWSTQPQKCSNVGYLIGKDEDDALYIAARKGLYNSDTDAWGLIERLPAGMVTKIEQLNISSSKSILQNDILILESSVGIIKRGGILSPREVTEVEGVIYKLKAMRERS